MFDSVVAWTCLLTFDSARFVVDDYVFNQAVIIKMLIVLN